MMDHYLRGAWAEGFDDIFVKADLINCNGFTWEHLKNGNRADNRVRDRTFLKDILLNGRTKGMWYFCRAFGHKSIPVFHGPGF